jgi:competence protein ComEA
LTLAHGRGYREAHRDVAKGLSVISIIVAVLGGIVLAVTFYREIDRRVAPPIIIQPPVDEVEIVVSVEGAVASPGLVTLPEGSRWGDAVRAAGGFLPEADMASVNLAARLVDGERLIIARLSPATGQRSSGSPSPANAVVSPQGTSAPDSVSQLININTATESELDALPGVGPVLAKRIVEYRTAQGRFTSVDELEEIRGISARMVADLRPLVTL